MEIASQIALVLLMDRAWCGRKRLLIGKLIDITYAYSLYIQCVLIMSSALEFIAGVTCMACAVMYYPDINAVMINEWGLSKGFDISLRSLI